MPFVALVVFAFGLGMVWDKTANRRTHFLFALGAAVATVYFMR